METLEEQTHHEDEGVQDEAKTSESLQGTALSKKKQKKEKKMQLWLEQKVERRALQKLKRKQKRQEKIERGEDTGPSKKKLKTNTMKKSSCDIRVVIDCSFDDLMVDKDINKLGQQIQYCYSSNRRAREPLQLYLTSVESKTKDRLDRVGDYRGWDIHVESESYWEKFEKSCIVYLTSDSPNILQTLTADKVYIIGGLVDHNHHKSLCYNLAMEKGISHAQLPIGEYIQLSSRRVLTVNHVFEILLRFTETQSWKDAFFQVIPKRKQIGGSSDVSDSNIVTDNVCNATNNNSVADNISQSGSNDGDHISHSNCIVKEDNDITEEDNDIMEENRFKTFDKQISLDDNLQFREHDINSSISESKSDRLENLLANSDC